MAFIEITEFNAIEEFGADDMFDDRDSIRQSGITRW